VRRDAAECDQPADARPGDDWLIHALRSHHRYVRLPYRPPPAVIGKTGAATRSTEWERYNRTFQTIMRTTWSTARGLNSSVVCWLLMWGMAAFGYFGLQGVLFNLYLLRLGFGPEFLGLLLGAGQLLWGLAAFPAAAFGRRVGLRVALGTSYALMGITFALVLLVELLPRNLWELWLFGWWALMWVAAALATVNSIPFLPLLVEEKDRNAVFPMQQAVTAATTFLGSLAAGVLPGLVVAWMGGSLAEAAPYRTAMWLVPPLFLAGIPLLAGTRPLRQLEARTVGKHAQPAPLATFFVLGAIVVLQTAAEGPVRAFFNVYLDRGLGVAPAQIGLLIGAAQLLPVAGALVTANLLARWGSARTLSLSSLGTAFSGLLLASVPVWSAAGVGFMGVMTTASMHGPARNVFSQTVVAPRWRGTTAAILTIGMALGWATTAVAGGYLISSIGFAGLFALAAALGVAATALAWAAHRLHHRLAPAPAATANA
jgi:MFS family permease